MKLYELLLRTTQDVKICISVSEYKYSEYIYNDNLKNMSIFLLQKLYMNDFKLKSQIISPWGKEAYIILEIEYEEDKKEIVEDLIKEWRKDNE